MRVNVFTISEFLATVFAETLGVQFAIMRYVSRYMLNNQDTTLVFFRVRLV